MVRVGGYCLARPADQILVADVVLSVDEPPVRATLCEPGEGRSCRGGAINCLTHDLWDELTAAYHAFPERCDAGRYRLGKSS